VSVDEPVEGKTNILPNSVDVADDGTVYWSTSSCNFKLIDGVFDLLADGSGRFVELAVTYCFLEYNRSEMPCSQIV
jgi:hypothetical protein